MMRIAVVALLAVFGWTRGVAQHWVDLLDDDNVGFDEVRQAFESHWGEKGYERGKGYKQYKRWEDFTEPRTYPSGQRVNGRVLLQAIEDVAKMKGATAKSNSAWEPVGPTEWESMAWNPGLGRINVVAVDPQDPNKIYVGTPAGGLWRSTNGGQSWEPLTDHLTAIGVSGIAINPLNTDEIYIATGDGNAADTYSIGVLKSTDGGASWHPTGLVHYVSTSVRCRRILMDPNDPLKLYVATTQGLWISQNGGNTWLEAIGDNIRDIELHPTDPSIVYASGRRMYKSTDGGDSFTQIYDGVPAFENVNRIEMAVTPAEPNFVYLVAGRQDNSGFQGVYLSEDAGESFTLMSNTPNILTYSASGDGIGGQSWYDLAITASPTNGTTLWVGGINVWRSTDAGSSWDIQSHWVYPSNVGYTHADIHWLHYQNNTLWCGSDGGIFKSTNNGATWTDLSEGLQITQYYRIAVAQDNADFVLTGSQDNGTNIFSPGGGYLHVLGGDGNWATIDYSNSNIMYSAYPGGSFQRSSDGGFSFDDYSDEVDENGAWVTPFFQHPTQPATIFAAYQNVWRRIDDGPWTKISNFGGNTTLRTLRIAPSDPETIYTSTFGTLYRTTNGGGQWNVVSDGLPNLFITYVEVDPTNAQRVWVSMSGYNQGQKVYHSSNGGQSWQNVSSNLPNVPVNCISYQVGTNDGLYIGTDVGVFYKDGENINWTPFQNGLPNVVVNQLELHYPSQQVFASTFGRGMWRNSFFDPDEVQPVAQVALSGTTLCVGDSTTFGNLSVNSGEGVVWHFPGGTPPTSTANQPVVTYNEAGVYDVILVASNANGSDSITFANHLHVLDTIGAQAPFFEDFETGSSLSASGWHALNPIGSGQWKLSNETGYLSNSCVWVENYGGPSLNTYLLQSETYDLTQLDTAIVSMRVAYARAGASGLERLRVSISTDCGESWTFKKLFSSSSILPTAEPQLSFFSPEGPHQWQQLLVDNIQPHERTASFRIQLEFVSNGGNNIYVDDINLTNDQAVSTKSTGEIDILRVYPNPASDVVNVHLKRSGQGAATLELLDMMGRTVVQRSLPPGSSEGEVHTFSAKGLTAGVYVVRVLTPEGPVSQPLIIQ